MRRELSTKEKELISSIQLQAEASIEIVAKELRLKHHTVRYLIQKLISDKILVPYPFINFVPLGYNEYDLFCSMRFDNENKRTEFLEYLRKSPQISWLIEIGGEYQYGIGITANNIYSVHNEIAKISSKFGAIFNIKSLSTCLRWSVFRRKYLSSKPTRVNELKVGPSNSKESIDQIDAAILNGLSRFPELSFSQIARKINIPETTFSYRIKILREKKIFLGRVYGVECYRINMQVFRINISLSDVSPKAINSLYQFSANSPWIMSFVEFSGGWDISLRIEVHEASEAFKLAQQLNDKFSRIIANLVVYPVFHEHKIEPFPILDKYP